MIYPTLPLQVWAKDGSDLYGQPHFTRLADEKVCPVRLSFTSVTTTVRTDSAGTKGHAREPGATVVVLALPQTKIDLESKLVILGHPLRVLEVHPRFTVRGVLDHIQIHCGPWTD